MRTGEEIAEELIDKYYKRDMPYLHAFVDLKVLFDVRVSLESADFLVELCAPSLSDTSNFQEIRIYAREMRVIHPNPPLYP